MAQSAFHSPSTELRLLELVTDLTGNGKKRSRCPFRLREFQRGSSCACLRVFQFGIQFCLGLFMLVCFVV